MEGCGASGRSTPGDRMPTCLDGENPRRTASSCWLTFGVRDWPLRAQSPPISPPRPLGHLPMRGSVGAPPGERGRKGGGGEGRKKGRSQAGIPEGRGLSRSLRAEEVRRPGPSSRRPRPRRCLLGPPRARCCGFPKGGQRQPGRLTPCPQTPMGAAAGAPGSGPWVLAPHGPGRTCWAQPGQGQPPGPPPPHPFPRGRSAHGVLCPGRAWVPCQPRSLSQGSCWPAAAVAAAAQGRQGQATLASLSTGPHGGRGRP